MCWYFLSQYADHRLLHSFPTRRSSDLLMRMRERYPLAMHGVSMSIGSSAPLDRGYLEQVKQLARRVEPAWISDRSEEHTSELQSHHDLVCRLLLEKKKTGLRLSECRQR